MKLCQDVRFYSTAIGEIEPPDFETCDKAEFFLFYSRPDCIYIDGYKALEQWKSVLDKFGCRNHYFTMPGSYMYDTVVGEGWLNIRNEISRLTILDNKLRFK